MISVDLMHSITNPFISYQSYLNRYHVFVWSLSIINLVLYVYDNKCQGVFIEGICWIPYSNHVTDCFLYFYLLWYVCAYICILVYIITLMCTITLIYTITLIGVYCITLYLFSYLYMRYFDCPEVWRQLFILGVNQ